MYTLRERRFYGSEVQPVVSTPVNHETTVILSIQILHCKYCRRKWLQIGEGFLFRFTLPLNQPFPYTIHLFVRQYEPQPIDLVLHLRTFTKHW